jgi:hypothetical protein
MVGTGDTVTNNSHEIFHFGGFAENETSRSKLRAAQLTSASISGCGLSLSEQDNVSASLASASILQVTITRS